MCWERTPPKRFTHWDASWPKPVTSCSRCWLPGQQLRPKAVFYALVFVTQLVDLLGFLCQVSSFPPLCFFFSLHAILSSLAAGCCIKFTTCTRWLVPVVCTFIPNQSNDNNKIPVQYNKRSLSWLVFHYETLVLMASAGCDFTRRMRLICLPGSTRGQHWTTCRFQ